MDEIFFGARGGTGGVTLNRPQALNALTHRMTRQLDARLDAYFAPPAGGDLHF